MGDCDGCQKAFAENVLYQASSGKEAGCENIYVFPTKEAERVHKQFMNRVTGGQYGILLVDGLVGAGKSSYLTYLKSQIKKQNMLLSQTIISDVKDLGKEGYLPKSIIEGLCIPNLRWDSLVDIANKDESFRRELASALEKYESELDFESRPLTVAFRALSSDDQGLRDGATNWLRGLPPATGADDEKELLSRLKELGMPTRTKSIMSLPVKEVLYFLRTLSKRMGYNGFVVIVDEIEKAASLTKSQGRNFLNSLRDLINILMEAPDSTIASQKGLFVAFAISTEYLLYSGIIESTMQYEEKGRGTVKPKTLLSDSPRLATILNSMTQRVNADIQDREIHLQIGFKLVECHSRTNGTPPKDKTYVEGVLRDVEESGSFRTRDFVTAVMRRLSEVS